LQRANKQRRLDNAETPVALSFSLGWYHLDTARNNDVDVDPSTAAV
jgi:hypothetical protein